MDEEALVGLLRSRLDGLLAVYAFGSRPRVRQTKAAIWIWRCWCEVMLTR